MSRGKQIEEMANAMCNMDLPSCQECANQWDFVIIPKCDLVKRAERLYEKGYRKQSEGEWVFNKEKDEFFCSVCNAEPLIDPHFIGIDYGIEILSDFCPWCGAKMKGGAE